ncbi:MAG: lysostaphin resistance A-like protein [Candidatus Heimdallarchaeota archaeon]
MSEDEDIQETNDIEEIFESEQEVLEPLPVSFSEGKLFARATLWTTVIYSSTFELIGLIIGTIAFLIAAFANINLSDDTSSRYIFTILLINAVAVIFMGILVYIINRRTAYIPSTQKFSLNKFDGKILLMALGLIIFLVGGIQLLNSFILTKYFPDYTIDSPYNFLSSNNVYVLLLASILVIIIAPIVEEMFYRWTVVSTLKNGMNTSATILFSALIFALAHSATNLAYSFYFFIIHFVTTFIIGAIFAFIYIKTKKIIVTIILHSVWNALTTVGAVLEYAGHGYAFNIAFLVLVGISGIASIAFSVLYLVKQRKVNQDMNLAKTESEETHKPKIKLKGEWFELIIGYLGLNVLLPFLIINVFSAINFFPELIVLLYFCVTIVVAFYVLTNQYKLYDRYTRANQQEALESSEQVE